MLKDFIFKKIKEIFNDNDKITVLSVSFLFVAVFLLILSTFLTSKTVQTQRTIISTFCFFIGFYLLPLVDMERKDKLVLGFSTFCGFFLIGIVTMVYWFSNLGLQKVSFLSDIFFLILTVISAYYFMFKLFQIVKVLLKFINKLSSRIFPNSLNSTGFKFFIERLTAIVISVSTAFGAILAVASSTKALISLFK